MKMLTCFKKTMKCTFAIMLLAFACTFTAKSTELMAATTYSEKIDGIKWNADVREDGTVSVAPDATSYISGEVGIPEEVLGYTVTRIKSYAFYNCADLTKITIPSTVTSIGDAAFKDCTSLNNILLPNRVVDIGNHAFSGCKSITSMAIPSGVATIGDCAFKDCTRLTDLTISNSTAQIGYGAFENCSGLSDVVIPQNLKHITVGTFHECSNLGTVFVPGSVNTIEESAFLDCKPQFDIYYRGSEVMWNNMDNTDVEEFTSSDGFSYRHIHFSSPIIEEDPVSAIHHLEEAEVAPLSVTAAVEMTSSGQPVGELSYQWYKNEKDSNVNGTEIPGETTASFLPPVTEEGEFYYYCVVTSTYEGGATSLPSKAAQITVIHKSMVDVSFISNCDAEVPTQTVAYGETVSKPENVVNDGYVVENWYTDEALTKVYDFNSPVKTDIVLYAKWSLDYSKLQEAVDIAQELLTYTEYMARITDSSIGKYSAVVTAAQEMVQQKTATCKEAIDNMIIQLTNAKKMLIIKPEERPVPHIKDGSAYITLHEEQLIIHQYVKGIAFNAETFDALYETSEIKGAPEALQTALSNRGFFTFFVNDSFGDAFYLIIYYTNIPDAPEGINVSNLAYEIRVAQTLCDSVPVGTAGLGVGASYTDQASKDTFQNAINSIIDGLETITSQEDVDNLITSLKASEEVFTAAIQQVEWARVEVDGSTVRVIPMEDCVISKVEYNVNEDGSLSQGIWNSWAGFRSIPYTKKYNNFVWENVADGVYTFIIYQKDPMGYTSSALRTFTVEVNTAKEDKIKEYLAAQLEEAKEVLASLPSEADVDVGETCVSAVVYNRLVRTIRDTETLIASQQPSYEDLIDASIRLRTAVDSFNASVKIKDGDYKDAVIKITRGNIYVYRGNLYRLSIAKGSYGSWQEFKDSDYTELLATNGAVSTQVSADGWYTLRLQYKDDTSDYIQIQVTDLLEASEENGIITVAYHGTQDVISTDYAFDDGSGSLIYKTYNGFKQELPAFGNGRHSIKLVYADETEGTVTVDVTGCNAPVVIAEENSVTVHDYGFSLNTAVYAKGHFTDWDEMQSSIINLNLNIPNDTTNLEKGEYTFYFIDADGRNYWQYAVLS